MPKPSKNRGHSFSGCWTCRRRRVKCSLERPLCTRCTAAGLECLGYGFRFDVPSGVQSSRQILPEDARPDLHLKLSSEEIDEHLSDLETTTRTTHKGPFSVLAFSPETSPKYLQAGSSRDMNNTASGFSLPHRSSSSRAQSGPQFELGRHLRVLPSTSSRSSSPSIPQMPSLIHLSTHERELFEHYIYYISEQLSPFAGSMHGQKEHLNWIVALNGRMGAAPESHATDAVFHAILAASAMSFAKIKPRSETYRFRALGHENLALGHLRSAIESGSSSYTTMAIAVMTFLVYEHIADRGHCYRAHLQAGLRCMLLCMKGASTDGIDTWVMAICEQWALGCTFANGGPVEHQALLRKMMGDGTGYLMRNFGIGFPLLDAMIATNIATMRIDRLSPCQIDEVEAQVLAAEEASLYHPISKLVYKATYIYFRRGVRRTPPQQIVPYIRNGLQLLESIPGGTPNDINSAPISWAACTIGSECKNVDDRTRFLRWCSSRAKMESGNIHAIRSLMSAVWQMRDTMPDQQNTMWNTGSPFIDSLYRMEWERHPESASDDPVEISRGGSHVRFILESQRSTWLDNADDGGEPYAGSTKDMNEFQALLH